MPEEEDPYLNGERDAAEQEMAMDWAEKYLAGQVPAPEASLPQQTRALLDQALADAFRRRMAPMPQVTGDVYDNSPTPWATPKPAWNDQSRQSSSPVLEFLKRIMGDTYADAENR